MVGNLTAEDPSEEQVLDLRGLKCPLPALFARRALARLSNGGLLLVLTDDPLAPVDIPHMCHQEGYEVVKAESSGGSTTLVLWRPQPIGYQNGGLRNGG